MARAEGFPPNRMLTSFLQRCSVSLISAGSRVIGRGRRWIVARPRLAAWFFPDGDGTPESRYREYNGPDGGYASLSDDDFNILQFHMHAPGEETVDGKRYPFNAHLVHINPGDSENDTERGKLAVIGIFFQEGKENAALKPVFDVMPAKVGKVVMKDKFDVSKLLPKSLAYYSYSGSLTTPGCNEGVTFYILKTPVEMSAAQLTQFKKIFPMNARPVMPLNGRKITEGN